jgi:hypothetical protein
VKWISQKVPRCNPPRGYITPVESSVPIKLGNLRHKNVRRFPRLLWRVKLCRDFLSDSELIGVSLLSGDLSAPLNERRSEIRC